MKILMLGWEFPPYKSGGLGTACYALTKGLAREKVKIHFVMPVAPEGAKASFVDLIALNNVRISGIDSILTPYMNSESYHDTYITQKGKKAIYGKNMFQEVARYTKAAAKLARDYEHDIIHAHDWMTFEAAIAAKHKSKKPVIAHLHATEFDRTGGKPNPHISHIEWLGLTHADAVITNSEFSKKNIIKHYKIPPNKIQVVHWGIDDEPVPTFEKTAQKTVLFLGRMTLQKGPDYFIEVAHNVLKHVPDAQFIVAGDGDMLPRIIHRSNELGIANRVSFTGMLHGDDVHHAFQSADVYVMPSVSEPFGLVALESMKNGTPTLISKQSGVSEIVAHTLRSDFWNIQDMTNKIVAILSYPSLKEELSRNARNETRKHTIQKPAQLVKRMYETLVQKKRAA